MPQDHFSDASVDPEIPKERSGGLKFYRSFIPIVVTLLSACLLLFVSRVSLVKAVSYTHLRAHET